MTGPTTAPNPPASSSAMRDRKRSALSLLLSTKPRRLLARSPSRGAGGTGGDSSVTVGSSTDRTFRLLTAGYDWIQFNPKTERPQGAPGREVGGRRMAGITFPSARTFVGRTKTAAATPRRVGRDRASAVVPLTPAGAAVGGSPCPWW